jgi:hypothetical protein
MTPLALSVLLVAALTVSAAPKKEINTPAAKGERLPDRLKVGDLAPDFSLPLIKGAGEVKLSAFRGKRPVVLIFASYT